MNFNLQGQEKNIEVVNDTTAIITLSKQSGFGPMGWRSFVPSQVKDANYAKHGIYPITKNKPNDLINPIEYYFVYNKPQFFFQNYSSGLISKNDLIREFKTYNLELSDTANLSKTKIITGFSVIAGKTIEGKAIYYVDTDHDQDYANEIPQDFITARKENEAKAHAFGVNLQFYIQGDIIKRQIRCLLKLNSTPKGLEVSFAFPEYQLAKVKLANQEYIICLQYNSAEFAVFVLPDEPHFSSVLQDALKVGNLVMIKDNVFKISQVGMDGSYLIIQGKGIKSLLAAP